MPAAVMGAVLLAVIASRSNSCGESRHRARGKPTESSVRPASYEEGVAVAIVYDTSGSMAQPTALAGGGEAPKYVVANKALSAIVDRLEAWSSGGTPDAPRNVEIGLYAFDESEARTAVSMGPGRGPEIRKWIAGFRKPDGPTPLGEAIAVGGLALLSAKPARKHLLIVTDGESNRGRSPAEVLHDLREKAESWTTSVSSHFVAFDVNASVFAPAKAAGATLVSASNEAQLNEQLTFLLEKKILLEDEEPAVKTTVPGSGM